jgi:hypothetical protein
MPYSKQYHAYRQLSFGANDSKNVGVPVFVPFRVKEVKFDFAYNIVNDGLPNIIVSSQLANNDIVGCLNRYMKTGQVSAAVTPAQFLASNIENTQVLSTTVPITVRRLAGGQLPADTTASISIANFNADAIGTQTDPMDFNNPIAVDFSHPTMSAYISPAQFAAADITRSGILFDLEAQNIISGTIQTGVIDVASFTIAIADFDGAGCSGETPSVMNAASIPITITAGGVLPAGTTGLITKANWDAANIPGGVYPIIFPANIPVTLTIPAMTASITVDQFNDALCANTNPAVTIANDCAVSLAIAGQAVNLVSLELKAADFAAAGIVNRIYQNALMPITFTDTISGVWPTDVVYGYPINSINSTNVDKNVGPLALGGPLTLNVGDIPVVMPTANFDARNILVTTNPLAIGANIALTIGGNANLTTQWFADGFSEDKVFSYVFRDPIDVNGTVYFNFNDLNSASNNILFANVSVHMEFLG